MTTSNPPLMRLLLLFCLVSTIFCWNTIYDYNNEKVYIYLPNNDLLQLDFATNYRYNQTLAAISSPPANSSLFIAGDSLYGFYSDEGYCGKLQLTQYDVQTDQWTKDVASLSVSIPSDIDGRYLQGSSYLTDIGDANIYIYGGICPGNSTVSDRLISCSLSGDNISSISTTVSPSSFYGATNTLINGYTNVLIGGQSTVGWLNMYQLAVWQYGSWTFRNIETNSTVNARKNAVVLPLWQPASNYETTLNLNQVLMLGGELLGNVSAPSYAKLHMGDNWYWETLDEIMDIGKIYGAATIYDKLVVVNETSSGDYHLTLFDSDFKMIDSFSHSTSLTTKIVVGVVVPVVVILIATISYLLYKRKSPSPDTSNRPYDMVLESSSTLGADNASIDSWVKKRNEYEKTSTSYFRDSNASHLTLTTTRTHVSDDNPKDETGTEVSFQSTTFHFLNRSLTMLKSTFNPTVAVPSTVSHTPTHHVSHSARKEQERPHMSSPQRSTKPHLMDDEVSDDESVNADLDVQVLVSSKRRSILRVMNPDLGTIFDEDEDAEDDDINGDGTRKRVPSLGKLED